MNQKKDIVFYLQHKLPWETDWVDIEIGESENCKQFIKVLIDEPPHLVETEYRIIQKKQTILRNNKKSVICPMCIMDGKQLSNKLKELRRES